MKIYVRPEDLKREDQLQGDDGKGFLEVVAIGPGRCRQLRLEEVAPDIAQALTLVNQGLVLLLEQLNELATVIQKEKRRCATQGKKSMRWMERM